MATQAQSDFIADLAVCKTKEFKEVKEMLVASGIVSENAEMIHQAASIADIANILTDLQASQFIDLLTKAKEPVRGSAYADKRVKRTISILDDIKSTIDDWDFEA